MSCGLNVVNEKHILLAKEKNDLQSKCAYLQEIILKFSKSEGNLNKIPGSQKVSFNNGGINFNFFNEKKCYRNFFVKSTNHESSWSLTSNYCAKIRHIYCPIKRNYTHKLYRD